MYNRVVLVCKLTVYLPDSLSRGPILKYQLLQVPTNLYSFYLQCDDWFSLSCREYSKQLEMNTARHLLSTIFIVRYFKYRKQKPQLHLLRKLANQSYGPNIPKDNWYPRIDGQTKLAGIYMFTVCTNTTRLYMFCPSESKNWRPYDLGLIVSFGWNLDIWRNF